MQHDASRNQKGSIGRSHDEGDEGVKGRFRTNIDQREQHVDDYGQANGVDGHCALAVDLGRKVKVSILT